MGLTVDVEIGCTFPLADYSNIKTRVAFNGLDPSQPIEPQLEQALSVVMAAAAKIDSKTEEIIVNTASLAANQPGVADRLRALEEGMAKRKENEGKIAAKIREILPLVTVQVKEVAEKQAKKAAKGKPPAPPNDTTPTPPREHSGRAEQAELASQRGYDEECQDGDA